MTIINNDICDQIKSEARTKAVFTDSQIEQIVKINVTLQDSLITYITDLKKKNDIILKSDEILKLEKTIQSLTFSLSHLTTEVSRVENVNAKQAFNINELFEYDNANNQIIADLRKQIHNIETEILNIEKVVKSLMVKDFHDERVDRIIDNLKLFINKEELCKVLTRLTILEAKEYRDERIEQIIHCLEKFETKKEAEEIIKRLLCLENRKFADDRFSDLKSELCDLRKELDKMRYVNLEQNKIIKELDAENLKQNKEIECLNSMLKRNTLALSDEIQEVERQITLEEKVDFNQNADIKFLQSELLEMKRQIDRMVKAGLVNECDC